MWPLRFSVFSFHDNLRDVRLVYRDVWEAALLSVNTREFTTPVEG